MKKWTIGSIKAISYWQQNGYFDSNITMQTNLLAWTGMLGLLLSQLQLDAKSQNSTYT